MAVRCGEVLRVKRLSRIQLRQQLRPALLGSESEAAPQIRSQFLKDGSLWGDTQQTETWLSFPNTVCLEVLPVQQLITLESIK